MKKGIHSNAGHLPQFWENDGMIGGSIKDLEFRVESLERWLRIGISDESEGFKGALSSQAIYEVKREIEAKFEYLNSKIDRWGAKGKNSLD